MFESEPLVKTLDSAIRPSPSDGCVRVEMVNVLLPVAGHEKPTLGHVTRLQASTMDGVFCNLNAEPEIIKIEPIGMHVDKPPVDRHEGDGAI